MSTRIYRACDNHEAQGVDVEGTPRGPFAGRMIDLCDACMDELAGPLMALVEDRGVPVVDAPARRGPGRPGKAPRAAEQPVLDLPPTDVFPCPLCGAEAPTVSALASHFKRVHHMVPGEVFGNTCPLCGGQGRGTHIPRAHAVAGGMPGAFAAAEAAGDPYGVVAARRKVWATMAA